MKIPLPTLQKKTKNRKERGRGSHVLFLLLLLFPRLKIMVCGDKYQHNRESPLAAEPETDHSLFLGRRGEGREKKKRKHTFKEWKSD